MPDAQAFIDVMVTVDAEVRRPCAVHVSDRDAGGNCIPHPECPDCQVLATQTKTDQRSVPREWWDALRKRG